MKRLLSPTRSCMLLLACFFVTPGGAFGEETEGSLDRAAAKYREAQATEDRDTRLARFASAQRLYWQLTQSDSPSAGLWTNAGNQITVIIVVYIVVWIRYRIVTRTGHKPR